MFSGEIIFFKILQQVPFNKFLNISQSSNGTDRISNVNQYSKQLELIFYQLGKNIINFLVWFT